MVITGLSPPPPEGVKALTGDGDVLRQVTYLLLFLLSVVLLGIVRRPQWLLIPPTLFAVFAWCSASVFWAIEPAVAARRLVLTLLVAWTVLLCVKQAGFDRSVSVIRQVLILVLVLNYAAILVLPEAIHRANDAVDSNVIGNWRGWLLHKNITGPVCAITILFFFFHPGAMRPVARWATIAAAGYFLLRTMSKTSMALLAFSLIVGLVYLSLGRRSRRVLVPIIFAAVLIGGAFALASLNLYDPRVLTGRSQIWLPLMAYAEDNLLFGAGFGSFWNVGSQSPIYHYADGWVLTEAVGHNGYLDLLTQIGLPGLILAVFAIILAPVWTLLTNGRIATSRAGLLLAGFVFCAGHNLTESSLLNRDQIVGVFLIVLLGLVRQSVRESPRPAPAAIIAPLRR